MGIIRAAINAVGGGLADSYLEAYRPSRMGQRTAVAPGIFADAGQGRNTNTKRMNNVISNGSMIQVASGELMCLVDKENMTMVLEDAKIVIPVVKLAKMI